MGAHSPPLANPSLEEKPIPCFQNLPDQLTSHKWLHSSPKKWLEVPMMMTPSLNPLMHSKLEAKLMQKCSSIHSWPGATNSRTLRLMTHSLNSQLKTDKSMLHT